MLSRWMKKISAKLFQSYYNKKLLEAVEKKQTELVKHFLEKGVSPNTRTKDQQRQTSLAVAVNGDNLEIINLLLDAGADPNAKTNDEHGDTVLTIAASGDCPEIVEILLKRGADPNGRNGNNTTPLFYVDSHNKEIYKQLLLGGADPNIKDDEDDTALRCACTFDNPEVIKLLLSAGAEINAKTQHGTPLEWSAKQGSKKVVQLLEERLAVLSWLAFLQVVRNTNGLDRDFSKELLEYMDTFLHKPANTTEKKLSFKKIVNTNAKIADRISAQKSGIFQHVPQKANADDDSRENNLQIGMRS